VQVHPHLQEELNIFLQTRLNLDDAVTCPHKSQLFKSEATHISINNCETFFLNYIDNELTPQQKLATETFVLQNPQLQASFTILKQSKLPQETIVFKNKESLLRKETSKGVITMRWLKYAIAAVIIGLLATTVVYITGNKNSTQPLGASIVNNKGVKKTMPTEYAKSNENVTVVTTGKEVVPTKVITVNKNPKQAISSNKNPKQNVSIISTDDYNIVQPPVENAVTVAQVSSTTSQTGLAGNSTPAIVITSTPTDVETIADEEIAKQRTREQYAARYVKEEKNNTSTLNSNNNNTLYIGSLEVNKNKFKGLIKKAGKLLKQQ
jgi:hypothetical protein